MVQKFKKVNNGEAGKKEVKGYKEAKMVKTSKEAKKVKGSEEAKEVKSGKKALLRCSPTFFRAVMAEVSPKMSDKQKKSIENTPLGPWLNMPKLPISSSRVDLILKRFQLQSRSFVFGENIVVPFTSPEFSIVLGLRYAGQPVDLDVNLESKFVARHFSGKVGNMNRNVIYERLSSLAGSENNFDVDDFVRMFICFVFNCIIFPVGHYSTPRFIMPYIDDLTTFFDYSWGDAAYRFLNDQISKYIGYGEGNVRRKKYLDGSTVGLMAWLYEKIPSLGVVRSLHTFPRLFRWRESKIPKKADSAERLFKRIDYTKVLSMVPFSDEDKLFHQKRGSISVPECAKCGGIIDGTNWWNSRPMAKDSGGEPWHESEIECESNANECESEEKDESSEDINGKKENKRFEVKVDGEGDIDGFLEVPVEKNIISAEHSVQVTSNESDSRSIVGSLLATGMTNHFPSSIARTVMTREDRVKKKKAEIFVTPPSTTPKRMRKVGEVLASLVDTVMVESGDTSIDVTKIGKNAVEDVMNEFRERADFCGHEEATDEERKMLTEYLSRDKLDAVVWEEDNFVLGGLEFCGFLFRNPVRWEIIDCYMRIMKKQSHKKGFEMFCMDTTVQREVLDKLERHRNNRTLRNGEYEDFVGKLTSVTRNQLQDLNENLFKRCKYIIFPLNYGWHWFLLIYSATEGQFKIMNSKPHASLSGTAKVYARFLAGYMIHFSGFNIGDVTVKKKKCRHQGETLDCGVYTCLWIECLAHDDDEMWNYEREVKMDTYRAHMAAVILSDENGMMKK